MNLMRLKKKVTFLDWQIALIESAVTPHLRGVEAAFDVQFEGAGLDNTFDTIGGLIAHEMGHVPKRGEYCVMAGLNFLVLHTKGGVVKWFKVSPIPPSESDA